jgi:hypothetical protein
MEALIPILAEVPEAVMEENEASLYMAHPDKEAGGTA